MEKREPLCPVGTCLCVCSLLSRIQLFATPQTVAHKVPLFMEFSRQENWSGLSFPSPGDLADPRIKTESPTQLSDSLPSESHQEAPCCWRECQLVQILRKTVWRFLKKLELSYNPTVPLVFTQRKQNHYLENISALQRSKKHFLQLASHGNKRSLRECFFFLMWHVYNWILFNNKKKEILPFVTTWIILSEVRQRKTYTNTVWSHLQMDSEKRKKKKMKPKPQITEKKLMAARGSGWNVWRRPKATNFQL